ncbi:MAG: LytTR family DNA-binding domain-containing protein [Chitinophagaceae bacterium]
MDTKIKCIIVEDEPLARELLTTYIGNTPNLEILQQFDNGAEAFSYLQSHKIDLAFSDIEMPALSGMDLVKSLKNAPYFIFTTAYQEYAIDGFEVGAIDYIRKPVTLARFLKAVQRAESIINNPPNERDYVAEEDLFFRMDGTLHRVRLSEIRYIETKDDYVKIHLHDGTSVEQHSTMKAMEELLPKDLFYRIHTSYIVPLQNIRKLFGNTIVLNTGEELPVAKPRKPELYQRLNIRED